jgi:hypothetical protein
MTSRFIDDPNSTIGSMIKRGLTGDFNKQPAQFTAQPTLRQTKIALDTLDRVINEVEQAMPEDNAAEGVVAQAVPQAISQTTDTLNPAQVSTVTSKEAAESVSLDQVAVDAARGAQQAELEPSPEIPPEVESYLQKVEDHRETAPKEIVIADGSQTQPNDHQYPAEPVVVLPITEEEEQAGAKKSPKFSIRWLVEWSRRLMKIFTGKIVYRPTKEVAKGAT